MTTEYTIDDLVLCESPDGWSLHAPGSTDEDIASGDAPYILSGPGEPTRADYEEAWRLYLGDPSTDDNQHRGD